MKYSNLISGVLLFLFMSGIASAQIKTPDYNFESGASFATGQQMPFWLISNQYGLITPSKSNLWLKAGFHNKLDPSKKVDYDYGIDIINRYADNNKIYLHQGYARLKLYFIRIQAGSIEEKFGNQDSSLSSGGLLWSGNARPMPKISIMVPDYMPVPFSHGYLEFKGGISHGWFENNGFNKNLWLHHKYGYLQFGGKLPVHIHYGFHHYAEWGGEVNGVKEPHSLKDFVKIFFARHGGSNAVLGDQINVLGNHLGTRNFGMDVDFSELKAGLYWQTIFEDGSGLAYRNISDGLWGFYLHPKNRNKLINGFVYEFVKTTNQGGTYNDYWMLNGVKYYTPVPGSVHHEFGGNDNYFNHYEYLNGWTYHQMTIGTPLITSPIIYQGDLSAFHYIGNNKIKAHHIGLEGMQGNFHYTLFYTYSINYGANIILNGLPANTFDVPKKQNSFLLKTIFCNILPWNTKLMVSLGVDRGKMYGDNLGIMISLVKIGSF